MRLYLIVFSILVPETMNSRFWGGNDSSDEEEEVQFIETTTDEKRGKWAVDSDSGKL